MARLAWVRRLLSYKATRSTYTGPSRPAISSAILRGCPVRGARPSRVVVVRWPISVVGAICPPVIPYTELLMNITVMGIPSWAVLMISASPMDARSPSPW